MSKDVFMVWQYRGIYVQCAQVYRSLRGAKNAIKNIKGDPNQVEPGDIFQIMTDKISTPFGYDGEVLYQEKA